jgi:DNA helicase-2/ATP-dependent DNA helicase PcrA
MADKKAGGSFKDNAVLYRMNAQSNFIERSFIQNNIPYRVYGGMRFYDRKER